MSFNRFILDLNQTVTGTGIPHENAYLIFYQVDQVTQQTTYADYLCTVPSTTVSIMYNSTLVNAVQADADGIFPTIFFPDDTEYYYVLLDEDFDTIKTENHVSVPPVSTLTSNQFVEFDGNTYIGRSSIEIVGTTYAIDTASSWGNIITFNNPNPVAVTIAAPNPSAFPAGWIASFQNLGAGVVTITGGANINGTTTLVLKKGDGVNISSDGTIFNAETGTAEIAYYNSGAILTVAANAITVTNSQHLINTSSAPQTINTISGGSDGQLLELKASSASNSLTITNGSSIKLQGGENAILKTLQDNIILQWDLINSWWVEISRSSASAAPLTYTYTSSDQAITYGTANSLAHGFPGVPKFVNVYLVNQITQGQYVPGDVIQMSSGDDATGGGNLGLAIYSDTINITYRFSSNGIAYPNKTSSDTFTLTAADWKVRVIAYY